MNTSTTSTNRKNGGERWMVAAVLLVVFLVAGDLAIGAEPVVTSASATIRVSARVISLGSHQAFRHAAAWADSLSQVQEEGVIATPTLDEQIASEGKYFDDGLVRVSLRSIPVAGIGETRQVEPELGMQATRIEIADTRGHEEEQILIEFVAN
jgi:hypothetical protein